MVNLHNSQKLTVLFALESVYVAIPYYVVNKCTHLKRVNGKLVYAQTISHYYVVANTCMHSTTCT